MHKQKCKRSLYQLWGKDRGGSAEQMQGNHMWTTTGPDQVRKEAVVGEVEK